MSIRKKKKVNSNYTDFILIDFKNFLFKHLYGFDANLKKMSEITDSEHSIEGRETKLIKGIFTKLCDIKKKFPKSKMVICLDTPRKRVWRKKFYPDYKGNRTYSDEGIDYGMYFNVIDKFKEDLYTLIDTQPDMYVVGVDKMEADDLIFLFTQKYYNRFDATHILSMDGDLTQLKIMFGDTIHQYDKIIPQMKKINKPDNRKYMIDKVIKGDDGDNILSIGSTWRYNPKFVSFMINKVFDAKGKLYSEEDMIAKLKDLEKNDTVKFNNNVTSYKRIAEKRERKIITKHNKKQFGVKEMVKLFNENIDLDSEIQHNYEDWIYRNYLLNKKIVLFTEIPKFLLKKCEPHIKFESNVDTSSVSKRMIRLVYDVSL